MTSIYSFSARTLGGEEVSLDRYRGKVLLIVNTASECGFTPQYAGLQKLYETYAGRDFEILGFPCNQFGKQEPGDATQIGSFCEKNYGVSFPMFEKIDVNGDDRHPIYEELTAAPDAEGNAGDITWNFEKFLVSGTGEVIGRFRPQVEPEDPAIVDAIEAALPA